MRALPAPPRRIALLALSALLLLVPALWPRLTQPAAADTGSSSLLYDPGPAHDCYALVVEDPPDKNTTPDPGRTSSAGCGAFAGTEEFTRKSPERPTWDIGTYGWNTSNWGTSPGYSFTTRTAAKTVTMQNDASGVCGLHETNVSYTYPDSQLKPGPDRAYRTAADGRINVSYRAKIQQTKPFTCGEKRALLTTDLIFEDSEHGSAHPDVISVVHYDPGTFKAPDSNGVVWYTRDDTTMTCPDGCRVMVRAPDLMKDATWASIDDDFSQLFDKYVDYVNPEHLPKSAFVLRGVQIVSSNTGSSTTASVSDVDARLTPNAPVHAPLTYGLKGSDGQSLCLDDYNNATKPPAVADIWDCNGGDAQDWTIGQDDTLQIHGLCLGASGDGTADHTPVGLDPCDGGAHQKWVLGRYGQIYNPVSGRCLEVANGSSTRGDKNLELFDCWGGTQQKWWTPAGDYR
ncbi:RICIN domain-containing protein [Streptomyces murinus]|uniref:RICIN domain-containing protein n=1 Tax=Streptomyces murinus TaxID=33900 RepID=UPI000A3AA0E9|nr:RICIN domain-containing protein [Streptomyces murinus]